MDGIQPYAGGARTPAPTFAPTSTVPAAGPTLTITPALAKTPGDYLRALRRRVWLVLAVSLPVAVLATIQAVRQPAVYRASAQVWIEPPQYDVMLHSLLAREVGQGDRESSERYLPNRLAQLKNKGLAEQVVNDPAFTQGGPPDEEAGAALAESIQTKINVGTNQVTVSLEGTDPARTAKLLYALLDAFQRQAKNEIETKNDDVRQFASDSLKKLKDEVAQLDQQIYDILKNTTTVGPDGSNIIQDQYESLGSMLMQKRMRASELQQQAWISQLFPKFNSDPEEAARKGQVAELQSRKRQLQTQLKEVRRRARNFDTDPTSIAVSHRLQQVLDDLEALRSIPRELSPDPSEMMAASLKEEVRSDEKAVLALLGKLRESMPEHQRYLALQADRKQKMERVGAMETRLSEFQMLARSQKSPITIPPSVSEPAVPVRPKRAMNIAMGIVASLVLGIGLVCALEHLDHSVKMPEHLTMGLTLPLCGVIPRIRRSSRAQRGGHLWTPGIPDSIEADAYRNLRASLLGVADRRGPLVTLLVTSAKAGEGKSTTALNLAATCARAGERTLLMDVDLRRPSLADVFRDEKQDLGLVDVLRGALPWQLVVVRTDIPNLDFLPTGDPRDVPVEVLGTLELRQLLLAVSSHYDRVILDGPAVLGLADCRMLGRIVDAALLVVRSGSHGLQPLQRAKVMLEQSHVAIAGVVFNGLYEDLQNWSSYGPGLSYPSLEGSWGTARSQDRPGLREPLGEDVDRMAGAYSS